MICFRYFKRSKNLDILEAYIRDIKIGDWFVLYQMSKNLNRRFFYDFLIKLAKERQSETYKDLTNLEDGKLLELGQSEPVQPDNSEPPPLMQDPPRNEVEKTIKIA